MEAEVNVTCSTTCCKTSLDDIVTLQHGLIHVAVLVKCIFVLVAELLSLLHATL